MEPRPTQRPTPLAKLKSRNSGAPLRHGVQDKPFDAAQGEVRTPPSKRRTLNQGVLAG
jgi:hypothetical protein